MYAVIRRSRHDENGAVLFISCLLLVVLLGTTALVIDIGIAHSQRRKMQSAADASALGAAQDLVKNPTNAAADASGIGSDNLSSFGTILWNSCAAEAVTNYTPVAGTSCVWRRNDGFAVRVRVPKQTFPALFGGALGSSGLATSTVAAAQIRNVSLNDVLPFALFSGVGNGETCTKLNPNTDPCPAPTTGNFNVLDIAQFGNPELGTDTATPQGAYCSNSENTRLEQNIAMGIDHPLVPYTAAEVDDICVNQGVNTLKPSTGNKTSTFTNGMLQGSGYPDGGTAHLGRGNGPFVNVDGKPADNNGLWQYIDPNLQTSAIDKTEAPLSCDPNTAFAPILQLPNGTPAEQLVQRTTMHAALAKCIADYSNGGYTGPVFTKNSGTVVDGLELFDIQTTPRLAYLPQFAQSGPCGNGFCLQIAGFKPVYIETLLGGCNNNNCSTDFDPGPWNKAALIGNTNDSLNGFTSFVLPGSMMPTGLGDNPINIGGNAIVQLVG